jgi:superfamily II DNA or RNA helicase
MRVTNVLHIGIDELSEREWRKLFKALRFQDNNGNVYEPWKISPRSSEVILPRGAWSLLPNKIVYHDERVEPGQAEIEFTGILDYVDEISGKSFSGQREALRSMVAQEQGIILAQPGFGKTQVALAFAALAETPTLVLVHTKDILQQWIDRCAQVVPDAEIGVIQGSRYEIGEITIATIQTFKNLVREDKDLRRKFGCVILDECHHAAAQSFADVLNDMPAKYRFGFTASQTRADGNHPYSRLVIGPIIYTHKFESKVPVSVVPVKDHKFNYGYRGSWDWRNLIEALISDSKRNHVIASIADDEIDMGNSILVLSREIKHLENILACMSHADEVPILKGDLPAVERHAILERFRSGEITCVLATQLADEALDVPILSRVILTFPGKHDGRLIQQVGRALREHDRKEEAVIYDIVDDRIGPLRRQWMLRKAAYKKLKIKVRKEISRNG